MGIWEQMPESFLAALDSEFGLSVPRRYGHDTVTALRAMRDEPGKVFVAMGGNFVAATPDTVRVSVPALLAGVAVAVAGTPLGAVAGSGDALRGTVVGVFATALVLVALLGRELGSRHTGTVAGVLTALCGPLLWGVTSGMEVALVAVLVAAPAAARHPPGTGPPVPSTSARPAAAPRRAAVASLIGTTIEWYDFYLYATATALVFNQLFFPEFSSTAGTLAAFGWSLYALFLGTAGVPGMTHPFELTIAPSDGAANIYLEVGAGVTTFILAGRYFEVRAKRRAGAALRALLELGAKEVSVLREGRGE